MGNEVKTIITTNECNKTTKIIMSNTKSLNMKITMSEIITSR